MSSREVLCESISTRYNVSRDRMFCQPTNLIPTSPNDITVNFDDEFVYPNYENGNCYLWHSGLGAACHSLGGVLVQTPPTRASLLPFHTISNHGSGHSATTGYRARLSETTSLQMPCTTSTDSFSRHSTYAAP
jgi:hypothetical protein